MEQTDAFEQESRRHHFRWLTYKIDATLWLLQVSLSRLESQVETVI
jgi:hypothetical protein